MLCWLACSLPAYQALCCQNTACTLACNLCVQHTLCGVGLITDSDVALAMTLLAGCARSSTECPDDCRRRPSTGLHSSQKRQHHHSRHPRSQKVSMLAAATAVAALQASAMVPLVASVCSITLPGTQLGCMDQCKAALGAITHLPRQVLSVMHASNMRTDILGGICISSCSGRCQLLSWEAGSAVRHWMCPPL